MEGAFSVLLVSNFFAMREDFLPQRLSFNYFHSVLCGQKGFNTEATETLRDLCGES